MGVLVSMMASFVIIFTDLEIAGLRAPYVVILAIVKMAKLQMPGDEGGLDVPNVRHYQLAAHLRVISEWLKNDPSSIWLDVETCQSKCPLFNLLFVKQDHLGPGEITILGSNLAFFSKSR